MIENASLVSQTPLRIPSGETIHLRARTIHSQMAFELPTYPSPLVCAFPNIDIQPVVERCQSKIMPRKSMGSQATGQVVLMGHVCNSKVRRVIIERIGKCTGMSAALMWNLRIGGARDMVPILGILSAVGP